MDAAVMRLQSVGLRAYISRWEYGSGGFLRVLVVTYPHKMAEVTLYLINDGWGLMQIELRGVCRRDVEQFNDSLIKYSLSRLIPQAELELVLLEAGSHLPFRLI
jgi:hypothetical protein